MHPIRCARIGLLHFLLAVGLRDQLLQKERRLDNLRIPDSKVFPFQLQV